MGAPADGATISSCTVSRQERQQSFTPHRHARREEHVHKKRAYTVANTTNARCLTRTRAHRRQLLRPSTTHHTQATRLYNLLCRTCVKSIVVWGPDPVVRRCSPQSLPEPASRRPPTHTSDSAPIDVHPTPTSLQFRVLYTYVCTHLHI
jgi:hypothetical protein